MQERGRGVLDFWR